MADHATPNLPSRDFAATVAFYGAIGFAPTYRSDQWLILMRGGLKLEFFPWPDFDPASSHFTCCLRLDDLDGMIGACIAAGIPAGQDRGIPRVVPPRDDPAGIRIGFLIDQDGTMHRLIQNPIAI